MATARKGSKSRMESENAACVVLDEKEYQRRYGNGKAKKSANQGQGKKPRR